MMKGKIARAALGIFILLIISGCTARKVSVPSGSIPPAGSIKPVEIKATDRCPVCGMNVHDYQNWAGEMLFKDGSVKLFDDPGCVVNYFLGLENTGNLQAILVRDYYTLDWIDGSQAYYVTEARVYTPMNYGVVPFKTLEKATEFKDDYQAGDILTFEQLAQRGNVS